MSRRGAAAAALTTIALLVAGCAPTAGGPGETPTATATPTASAEPTPTTSAEPTPSPTPSPTDPRADWQEIATPNGTATFRIPPGWTAEVGGEEVAYDGEQHWVNAITVRDETATMTASYSDGPYDDVGAAADFGVVRSTPVATLDADELAAAGDTNRSYLEHYASAWWTTGDGTTFTAHAGLATSPAGESAPASTVIDGERTVSFGVRGEFASEAEAVAWLESDDVTAVLEIVATLDLTGIPAPALP
ncbi:hypothetical protein [Agrococcus jenensis]|uniref:Lipoprotein n=1 Tax=Agrococcus jenensis TaxID=46353 RepID=A0A3N2ASH0_9MICO|nr:hypothetical protein [Agrococcus jenensis]ROR65940.1 hypothetical protein EDD26_1314 [Agrococcus jenensis]